MTKTTEVLSQKVAREKGSGERERGNLENNPVFTHF